MSRLYAFRGEPERPLEPPPWPAPPVCPVCGSDCEHFVRRAWPPYEIVGCDECMELYDPLEG